MGRPRVDGARTPSGQLSRAKAALAKGQSPSEWARIRDNLLATARNPHLGYELGRLFFHNRITASQFEAGRRYADTVQISLRTIGLQCLDPGDATTALIRRPFPSPGTAAWNAMTEDGRRAAVLLDTIETALGVTRGAVEEVCIRGRPLPSWEQFRLLVEGLDILNRFFSTGRKRA